MKNYFLKTLLSLVLIMSPVLFDGKNKTLPVNPFGLKDPLIGMKSPEPMILEWLNGKGQPLSSYRGKVVVMEFFQLWCPGCNKFSIPLMKEWSNKFKDNKNFILISIHTVSEGHSFQSPNRLRKFVKEK